MNNFLSALIFTLFFSQTSLATQAFSEETITCTTRFALAPPETLNLGSIDLTPIDLKTLASKSFGFTKDKLVVRLSCVAPSNISSNTLNFFIRYHVLDHIEVYEIKGSDFTKIKDLGDIDRAKNHPRTSDSLIPFFSHTFKANETKEFGLFCAHHDNR